MISSKAQFPTTQLRSQIFTNLVLLTVLALVLAGQLAEDAGFSNAANRPAAPVADSTYVVQLGQRSFEVTLAAATGAAIEFQTNNGEGVDGQPALVSMIPQLVLLRSGTLTDPQARTLMITIHPVADSAAAQTRLQVRLETQNGDPDRFGTSSSRLAAYAAWMDVKGKSVTLEITFGSSDGIDGELIDPTPTGYYRLVLTAEAAAGAVKAPQEAVIDYAFLLENHWITRLQDSDQPGPQELVIYYNDMTPFQYTSFDPNGRLMRQQVNSYIGEVVAPGMAAIFDLQKVWGFEWHEGWQGFRPQAAAGQLTIALTDRGIWYHGPAPKGGFGLISINVNQYRLQTYSSLTDWVLSIFSHELFHNYQRDLSLVAGRNGSTEGQYSAWEIVSEGTALLIESLTREALGFADGIAGNPYSVRAEAFSERLGSNSDLTELPFDQMSPYEMVVFWRYLYERSRSNTTGVNAARAGLEIIRQTLETLYLDAQLLNIQEDQLPASFENLLLRVLGRDYTDDLDAFGRTVSTWKNDA